MPALYGVEKEQRTIRATNVSSVTLHLASIMASMQVWVGKGSTFLSFFVVWANVTFGVPIRLHGLPERGEVCLRKPLTSGHRSIRMPISQGYMQTTVWILLRTAGSRPNIWLMWLTWNCKISPYPILCLKPGLSRFASMRSRYFSVEKTFTHGITCRKVWSLICFRKEHGNIRLWRSFHLDLMSHSK